eukprot:8081901-Alexandrium_andersonii.AAC.1
MAHGVVWCASAMGTAWCSRMVCTGSQCADASRARQGRWPSCCRGLVLARRWGALERRQLLAAKWLEKRLESPGLVHQFVAAVSYTHLRAHETSAHL